MPRPPRLQFPGAVYHVTTRGNERKAIFRDDHDREDFLAQVRHYRDRFGFRLIAYCLMTDHVHLAIRTGKPPLSRIMAGLQSSYAQRFNRRHQRVGHLFQGRYKSCLVQEDRHLVALIRYIHRNPVRAGIVPRAEEYPWSSDRCFRIGHGPAWLDLDEALSVLAPIRSTAIARYIELIDEPVVGSLDAEPAMIAKAIEGDEAFALERFAAAAELDPALPGLTIERVLEAVAHETGISVEALKGSGRGGEVARARSLAVYLARSLGGISVRRTARHLHRDDSSFVRPVAQLERDRETDSTLRAQLNRIAKSLGCLDGRGTGPNGPCAS